MKARMRILFSDTRRVDAHLRAYVRCERWVAKDYTATVVRYRIDNIDPKIGPTPVTVFTDAEILDDNANQADAIRYTITQMDELIQRWKSDPTDPTNAQKNLGILARAAAEGAASAT